MHLKKVSLHPERYPTRKQYPFNLNIFQKTASIAFTTPVTFFLGENGTGKSTLLEAIARRCGIHIWGEFARTRFDRNPQEADLYRFMTLEWSDGKVPGSFFASEMARHFAQYLDEWASTDPGMLEYFGGKSLMSQSHGQSFMSFFRGRYRIKGLHLLDEPETALSPGSQLGLLTLLRERGRAGHGQFIVTTHSPILLACPGATIYSFQEEGVRRVQYEDTEHYKIYKGFMEDRSRYITKTDANP
jgi:predicted ATPase